MTYRDPFNEDVLEPTGIQAIACQDYAGAFSCGFRQEGFDIVGKFEQADAFGMQAWLHNADWLAPTVWYESGQPQKAWNRSLHADVVYGNPPCSGFSILTAGAKWQEQGLHGTEAKQNQCMYDLMEFGSDVHADVIIFESVSNAMQAGRPLMYQLHNELEERTNKNWHLTLVRMNAMSVGGFPDRRRMFWIASRLGPIELPAATGRSHTLAQAIGDLRKCVSEDPRSQFSLSPTLKAKRNTALAGSGYWEQGMSSATAWEIAHEAGWDGPMPDRSDRIQNSFTAWRWKWDKPARVATGAVLNSAVHPVEPRTFTHAEVGRIMGFPSQYDLRGIVKLKSKGHALYGKGIPAQAGRWVAEGVRRHLLNDPGECEIPQPLDDRPRTWLVDVESAWRSNRWEQMSIYQVGA